MSDTMWDIEPHTEAKHDILRRYLGAWFPIMASYVASMGGNRLVYIDGFAGPGQYCGGQDGSPVIALKTLLQHTLWADKLHLLNYTFLFIERDAPRATHLENLLASMNRPPNVAVSVKQGEFEVVIGDLLDSLQRRSKTLAPALVFIDPFGPTGFSMSLVQQILHHRTTEVLITLNLHDLNRWFLSVPERHGEVDKMYGTQRWRECLAISDPRSREECLKQKYRDQLQIPGTRPPRDFRMVNKHNQTAYYLVYVTHHPRGLGVMKDAMSDVDPSGSFEYSDVTNPNQPFLFGSQFDEMHSREYAEDLRMRHAGKEVAYNKLKSATEEHPNYRGPHLTGALSLLVAEGKVEPSSPKRGRGWPAETRFRFLPLRPSQ